MAIDGPESIHVDEEQRENGAEYSYTGDGDGIEVPDAVARHAGKDANGGRG